MSSRNSFTTNYIYDPEVVEELASRIKHLGYGIKASGSGNGAFQVVGMIKNAESKSPAFYQGLKSILYEIKKKYEIEYHIRMVLISDDYNMITTVSTAQNDQLNMRNE